MVLRNKQSLRGGVAAALGTALFVGANLGVVTQAAAPSYERALAGIRLNSTAKTVLAKYGNPNEVVIGDVGARQSGVPGAPGTPGAAQGGPDETGGFQGAPVSGFPGAPTGFSGPAGSLPGLGKAGGGAPMMGGGEGGFPGQPSGFPGAPTGFPGAPGGFPQGGYGGPEEGVRGGAGGFGGGTVGPFGNTQSTVAREQEVTWIYNRKTYDKKGAAQLVSYEFLIGPSGQVEQIRVSGYTGGNVRTSRSIGLGSTYRDVIRAYGFPEEHAAYGNVLVASYRNRAHVSFQFLNDRVLSGNAINPGNKVIGITIATVE